MTTSALGRTHGAGTAAATTPSTSDRAADLIRIAEEAILDARFGGGLHCRDAIVRMLAADSVAAEVDERFASLVEAVREHRAYTDDPRSYAVAHDIVVDDRNLDGIDDRLLGEVDAAAWSLLSPTPLGRGRAVAVAR